MEKDLNEVLLTEQNNIEEIENAENYISKFIKDSDFNKLNYIKHKKNSGLSSEYFCFCENIEFISMNNENSTPYYNLMSEKEFFKTVGFSKDRFSIRSGNYQKSLYAHYLQAQSEKDCGYVSDVLKKAIVFRNNIDYVKKLMHNEKFMAKWHYNYGRKSPLSVLKNSGDMTLINIINAM